MARDPLQIDSFLPEIAARLRDARAVVVTAAPGAGKTTRVPPALAPDGPIIVLQPRRVAARSLARRIALEQGWTLGEEIGWHVRFERQFGPRTRVLLATEGILTARLQRDPLLSGFRTIVLDEFHERSVHADLGLALAKQAWLARTDLRLVVMSATIDAARVAQFLGACPVIEVPGAPHPVRIEHDPATPLPAAVERVARETAGSVLCFLAGAAEIGQARRALAPAASRLPEIVELHGSQPAAEQDAALEAVGRPRVVLATNIAETSLTVPGVSAVIDTGLHKVARYDPERAIDSLEVERIPRDSADQRAGRAGRLGPGFVLRLWHASDRLAPAREPELHRIDLSGPVLDVLAWGGDPSSLDWFDPPPAEAVDAAFDLLERLGATTSRRLTPLGREMQRLPIHPRLARVLLAAGGAREIAVACAILSERRFLPAAGDSPTTSSDLLSAVERARALPPHVSTTARALQSLVAEPAAATLTERAFRQAILAGYPDRVARRREPGSPRLLLASGHGAVLGAESGVRDAEFLVALDIAAGRKGEMSEARVRMASGVEREWLTPSLVRVDHDLGADGVVRASSRDLYGAIPLVERRVDPDPDVAREMLAEAYLARGLSGDDEQLVRRLAFAGLDADPRALVERAASGRRSLREIDLAAGMPPQRRRELDRLAPETLVVPSGRPARLEYREDGTVVASVKMQELFGLAETPRLGPRAEPVVLSLLAPNGRPVQITRDLRSFWERTYPDVRKELRARYPKHPWPEDPWSARATAGTVRRGSK